MSGTIDRKEACTAQSMMWSAPLLEPPPPRWGVQACKQLLSSWHGRVLPLVCLQENPVSVPDAQPVIGACMHAWKNQCRIPLLLSELPPSSSEWSGPQAYGALHVL